MSNCICVLCLGCFDGGLVSKAAELAKQSGENVQVLVTEDAEIKKAFFYGADSVGLLKNYEMKEYSIYVQGLEVKHILAKSLSVSNGLTLFHDDNDNLIGAAPVGSVIVPTNQDQLKLNKLKL